jgi:hypothetical protein
MRNWGTISNNFRDDITTTGKYNFSADTKQSA